MNGLIWFLVFGAFFYFMMRMGGCGSHDHGGHGNHDGHEPKKGWTTKDPVCGMEGPVNEAPCSTVYEGKMYHFCSTTCCDLFLRDPSRYIAQATELTESGKGGQAHGCH